MNGSINGFWTMLAIMVTFTLAFVVSRAAWKFFSRIKNVKKGVKDLKERIK